MVPAANRLRGDRNFRRLSKHGRAVFSHSLTVRSVKNNLEVSRFAFVVSLKTSKKTVDRNKLKRRLREIIRLQIDSVKPGFDVAISGKRPALDLSYQELQEALLTLLSKARLLQ